MTDETKSDRPWPNQQPVVDGVVPKTLVPQDPNFFDVDPEDAVARVMGEEENVNEV